MKEFIPESSQLDVGPIAHAITGAEPCPRCKAKYGGGRPPYFGDDPRCAFPGGGPFVSDNWQCATADLIRDLMGEYPGDVEREGITIVQCWDQKVATVVIHDHIDLEHYEPFIPALVASWYKRRGATNTLLLITDEGRAILPTAADIEAICAGYVEIADGTGRAPSPPVIGGENSGDEHVQVVEVKR